MKSLQNIYMNKANAILVIVDVENEFCKPGGKRYSETIAPQVPPLISAISELLERCRSADIPIIYVQSVRTLQEPEFTVFGKDPYLEVGTWAVEIVEELKPREVETVVPKYSHDPFYKTDLDQILQRLVPDPTKCYAVVTGGATDVCHYDAVMGFYLRNYWTVVPVDCTYATSEWGKTIALEQFSGLGYRSIFLTRSDLIQVSHDPTVVGPQPTIGR